jgi:hypothetical protein
MFFRGAQTRQHTDSTKRSGHELGNDVLGLAHELVAAQRLRSVRIPAVISASANACSWN